MTTLLTDIRNTPIFTDENINGIESGSWCPQKFILDYLWSEKFVDNSVDEFVDMTDKVTGNIFPAKGLSYFDGRFKWNDLLPSYVLSYNVEIPDLFAKYIISRYTFKQEELTFDWANWDPTDSGLTKIVPIAAADDFKPEKPSE